MNGSNDDGMVKWFHCLLGQFLVRILQKEHHDGNFKLYIQEICQAQCPYEDKVLSWA